MIYDSAAFVHFKVHWKA